MSSLRERLLAKGIKNKLIAIQKSKQIYEKISKWGKKDLHSEEKTIEKISNSIAARVEKYALKIEIKTGNQPDPEQIMEKIKEELDKILR
jgi:hypothetical protein